uniref:Uncharacterized protein n=1 Tax=Heterorhabditis bacteriophora TaxID=37862 RepID=A0A1I7XQM9_HETBA
MRENVIEQLEEEIKAKERLIYEQGHLINILENDHNETKFDAVSLVTYALLRYMTIKDSVTSDSEITIIERHCTSISPCKSDSNSSEDCLRYRDRLEQAMVDREKLELQNEQLLRQWEEALEYVSKVGD